jgi:hypothetical protein
VWRGAAEICTVIRNACRLPSLRSGVAAAQTVTAVLY